MIQFTQADVADLISALGDDMNQSFEVIITLMTGPCCRFTHNDPTLSVDYVAKMRWRLGNLIEDQVREIRNDFEIIMHRWPETQLYVYSLYQYTDTMVRYGKHTK